MKKGITPIIAVIILLLITVALAGMAWAFLSGYFTGLTGKTIAVVDYSCIGTNTAQVIVRNAGTDSVSLGACTPAGSVGGGTSTTDTCGDMTITKTSGLPANLGGQMDKTTIAKGENVIFTDVCTAGSTCTYRVVTSSAGIGPNPNVASVTC